MLMDIGFRARSRYLFPVKAMSKVFRGKLLEGLARLHCRQALELSGPCVALADADNFKDLMDRLYRKDWVVYAKRPFRRTRTGFPVPRPLHPQGGSCPTSASSASTDSNVCFRTKHGNTTTINAIEFVRRFLLHVLPSGFVKIRHYGLVAAANATTRLEVARRCLLDVPATEPPSHVDPSPTWRELLLDPHRHRRPVLALSVAAAQWRDGPCRLPRLTPHEHLA